jgi:hypothetical protein
MDWTVFKVIFARISHSFEVISKANAARRIGRSLNVAYNATILHMDWKIVINKNISMLFTFEIFASVYCMPSTVVCKTENRMTTFNEETKRYLK